MQGELIELLGARVMNVEDNLQRAFGGIKEELEMRPTKEQINRQLVSERVSGRSFVIKNSNIIDNLTRVNYEEKKGTLVDLFRSAINQIKNGTNL